MVNILKNYCKSSNLFIIRYIGDVNKTFFERCLWVVVMLLTSGQMLSFLLDDWTILRNGPFKVSLDDTGLRVANYDFPAVTICPHENINPKQLNELIERVFGSTPDEETVRTFRNSLLALSKVGNPGWDEGYKFLLSTNTTPFPINGSDIIPFFKTVLPSVEDLFLLCFWRGSECPCSKMFRLQSSEFGLCYSFNSFTSARLHNDSKTSPPFKNEKDEFVGLRTDSEGRSNCLEFFMKPTNHSPNDILFLLGANSPEIYPDTSSLKSIRPMPTMVYHLEIQLKVEQAEKSLWEMDKEVLSCSLGHVASVQNCLLECRQHHIWRHCQCALYTHAILMKTENTPICGPQHLKCIAKLTESLNGIQLVSQPPQLQRPDHLQCYCKPPCTRNIYNVRHEITPRESSMFDEDIKASVYIDAFYFSKRATAYVKRSRLTFVNLFANHGGTSGLMIGSSFMTTFEMIIVVVKLINSRIKHLYYFLFNMALSTNLQN